MDQSFGIKLPGLVPAYVKKPADIPALAVEFERLGFDDVMDGEHILYAAQMNHPGGAGNFEHSRVEQHSDRWDTLVMFAAIAARTTRLRLVSGIILAAAHTYAVLARQAATLDSISAGRFTLGVGGGWNAAEFTQLGISPADLIDRAARALAEWEHSRRLDLPGLDDQSMLRPDGPDGPRDEHLASRVAAQWPSLNSSGVSLRQVLARRPRYDLGFFRGRYATFTFFYFYIGRGRPVRDRQDVCGRSGSNGKQDAAGCRVDWRLDRILSRRERWRRIWRDRRGYLRSARR